LFGRFTGRAHVGGPTVQAAVGGHQIRRLRRVRVRRGKVRRRVAQLPRRMGLHAGPLGRAIRQLRGAQVPGGQGRDRGHVVLRNPGLQAGALGMPQRSHRRRSSAVAGIAFYTFVRSCTVDVGDGVVVHPLCRRPSPP